MEVSKTTSAGRNSQVLTLNPIRQWQTKFQVKVPDGTGEAPYHARRAHRKSRNGCVTCKKRRVKCDERRPTCQRCQNYGASCIYSPSPGSLTLAQTKKSQIVPKEIPKSIIFTMSVTDMISKLSDGLSGDLEFAPRIPGDSTTTLSVAVTSFQHFLNATTRGVGTARIRDVMRTDMIHVAFNTPYLMYTILGSGTLHINRMCPGNKTRELAEAYFWQQAIKLYQAAIESGISGNNISGLISACMLLGPIALCPPSFSVEESWVFTGRPSDLNWLCLQGGLATLLDQAGSYLQQSIWADPFSQSHGWEERLYRYDIDKGREGLHEGLADLCGIDDLSTQETNPYYNAVKLLSPLLLLEPNAENAAQAATWMGRLEHEYVALLRQRDPPALVLFAQWMSMMCMLSEYQPWVEGRIRYECIAICMYLERQGDPAIQPFLELPASSCGYTLQKV